MHPQKSTAHLQKMSPWENTSGRLLLYVKRVLKDLNYKKLLFKFIKFINMKK